MITTSDGKVISRTEKICRSRWSQTWGLMFRRRQNLIMVLDTEKKISLHMFFVFFPIDVLIVDEEKKIVEIKRDFRPFTFWTAKEKGKYVVEMGVKGEYEVGERLSFSF